MSKSSNSKEPTRSAVELEARVELNEEKISRYLMDDRLREASGIIAEEIQLVRRIKDGTSLSGAWVDMDGPVYTTVQVRRFTMEALCTCPAPGPCPHGGAVALLYLSDPSSFLDLDRWLEDLADLSKEDLLAKLRSVLASIPAALEMMDIPDFDGVLTAEPPAEGEWWGEEDWDDEPIELDAETDEELEGIYLDDDEEPPDPENLN